MLLATNQTENMTSVDADHASITVIIPTCRRPKALMTALRSVGQQSLTNSSLQILVVDNNAAPVEKDRVDAFAADCLLKVDYVHCPQSGVSHARNAGLAHAKTRFIAFLDDDMEASPEWVERSLSTAKKFNAGIVFSPTIARMPDPDDPRNSYMRPFFSHTLPDTPEGLVKKFLGTGGTFIDLSKCNLPSPAFDAELNGIGGEDDKFFEHLRCTGTKAAWSPEAKTYEIVPKSRATNTYVWERNFGYGQGPSRTQAGRGWKGVLGVLRFMTTGTLQFAVYGPMFVALKVMKKPAYVSYMAMTARAMGKIYWGKRFAPQLYAQPQIINSPAPSWVSAE